MPISPVSASAATGNAAPQTNIGLQDLLKILLAQLSYQDPLKPLDNQEFVAQIAQFSSLEQSRQANEKIDRLLAVQSATQSVGLLGRTVDITTNNTNLSGRVTGIGLTSGEPQLTLLTSGGQTINGVGLSQVTNVR